MGSQQRLFMMNTRFYRLFFAQKIEDLGIQKTGVYILEGLLRLRQICDDKAVENSGNQAYGGCQD